MTSLQLLFQQWYWTYHCGYCFNSGIEQSHKTVSTSTTVEVFDLRCPNWQSVPFFYWSGSHTLNVVIIYISLHSFTIVNLLFNHFNIQSIFFTKQIKALIHFLTQISCCGKPVKRNNETGLGSGFISPYHWFSAAIDRNTQQSESGEEP